MQSNGAQPNPHVYLPIFYSAYPGKGCWVLDYFPSDFGEKVISKTIPYTGRESIIEMDNHSHINTISERELNQLCLHKSEASVPPRHQAFVYNVTCSPISGEMEYLLQYRDAQVRDLSQMLFCKQVQCSSVSGYQRFELVIILMILYFIQIKNK